MRLKQKLPVSYLLFTINGRLSQGAFWLASLFYWCTFYVLYNLLLFAINETSSSNSNNQSGIPHFLADTKN
jgi:uncharacterized membrane protein YhaH (DUF805 family)